MTGTNKRRRDTSEKVTDMPQNMRKTAHGFEYRRVVPSELRAQIGKREIKKSLGKDFRIAKEKLAELEVETNADFARARAATERNMSLEAYLSLHPSARLKPISGSSPNLAGKLSSLWLSGLEADLDNRRKGLIDDEDFEDLNKNVADMLPRINRALATGNVTAFFPVISNLLLGRGYILDATAEQMQTLTHSVLGHIQVGYKSLAARQQGELISPDLSTLPEPLSAAWEKEPAAKDKSVKNNLCHRLSDVVPLYEKHLESTGRKNQTTNLSIWQRLIKFCENKPLNDVQSNDIYRFFEERLHDFSDPWSQNYAGRAKNVLRTAFGLAQTHNLVMRNPVVEMVVMPKISAEVDKKRQKPRFPYTTEQLNKIFESDWYQPGATKWRGKIGQDLSARYWVPLICLYHGLRIREALQLHTHDIIAKEIPLIKIQTELADDTSGPARHLKNESTKREIPAHPVLIELGFLEFIADVEKRQPNGPLFPSALPTPGGSHPLWGRAYEQRFLPHVRDTLKFGRGYGNHSFRHTLEDRIRDIQIDGVWPAGLSQFFTGRKLTRDSDRSVLRQEGSEIDYGNGYLAKRILPYVSKINFPGIKLPSPFKQWLSGHSAVHPELLKELRKI